MPKQRDCEVVFATAGQPNERWEVFTEDALREMAQSDSRCRYEEDTKQLWIVVPEITNLLEQMFAEELPSVTFIDVTPERSEEE